MLSRSFVNQTERNLHGPRPSVVSALFRLISPFETQRQQWPLQMLAVPRIHVHHAAVRHRRAALTANWRPGPHAQTSVGSTQKVKPSLLHALYTPSCSYRRRSRDALRSDPEEALGRGRETAVRARTRSDAAVGVSDLRQQSTVACVYKTNQIF